MKKRARGSPSREQPEQADTDPLAYTQVDRAVKPKAAQLAGILGESPQHALGSLIEFWDLNGDPRELEELLKAGKREVVLPESTVRRRFKLASGHEVSPEYLEDLGLLEKVHDGFRVRGMSRFFKVIEGKVSKRLRDSAGGRSRSDGAKRGPNGRFLPGAGAPAGPQAGAPAGPQAGAPAGPQAGAPAGERSGSSRERELDLQPKASTTHNAQRAALNAQPKEEPRAQPKEEPRGAESRTRSLSDRLTGAFRELRGVDYVFREAKDGKALQSVIGYGDDAEIERRWRRGLQLSKWPGISTIAQLAERWNDLTAPTSDVRRAPIEATRGSGPITAREVPL